jgi:hypothetical protein
MFLAFYFEILLLLKSSILEGIEFVQIQTAFPGRSGSIVNLVMHHLHSK